MTAPAGRASAAPQRIVSLVPSLTEAVAALGHAERLVGVTRFCVRGAPDRAARLRGTKNPSVQQILDLEPDLVLANREENREREVEALRAAGVPVHLTEPRTVADVGPMLAGLAEVLGAGGAADDLLGQLEHARAHAAELRPGAPLATLTLIWRRPWMGVGPDTYVDDLLAACGFANVLAGWAERYPRLDDGLLLGPEVVLLPDEPYAFGARDLPAVRRLVGQAPRLEHVDGRLLTWHGPSTPQALVTFAALAARLRGG